MGGVGDHGRLEPACAYRQLRDDQADNKQQDRRLVVVAVSDHEPLIGLGQEEVEPDGRRQRGRRSGDTCTDGGNRYHRDGKDQSRVRRRKIRAEGHEYERHEERDHEGREQGGRVVKSIPGHVMPPVRTRGVRNQNFSGLISATTR